MTHSGSHPPERRLILLRHGATVWNAEGRYTTRTDLPLSEAGRAQARASAAALADAGIDRVLCSPLRRARETAEAVAGAQTGPRPAVAVDERLTEIDAGPFEGLTPSEIDAGPLAAAHAAWRADTDPVTPAGAETLESAAARAAAFFAAVRELDGTTLAATHGSLTRVLIAAVVLAAHPAAHRRLWLDNGHWATVVLSERPRLVAFNDGPPETRGRRSASGGAGL
jgi:ribonuclease H / adenosylcobalamin/alpha-ribazole phosphatase